MKFLLLFMFVAIALADQESEVDPDQLAPTLARIFEIDPTDSLECVRKSEVTLADMRYADGAMLLNDTEATDMKSLRRAGCVMTCCAQKKGFMVGGVVDVEEMLKVFQKPNTPEDIKIQMRNIARTCKGQVTDTSDECMAGYNFIKCLILRARAIQQPGHRSRSWGRGIGVGFGLWE